MCKRVSNGIKSPTITSEEDSDSQVVLRAGLISGTALAVLLGASGTVLGQDEDAGVNLLPIIIQDRLMFTGAVEGYLAPATETGITAGVPLSEVPQSISVVTSGELEARRPRQVEDAIKYVPGINPSTWGTDDRFDQFSIRGFDIGSNSLYRDGLPQKVLGFNGFTTDPYMVERIDVLRGPAGVLYGSNDAGGMVNLVTKRPVFEHLGEARVGYGSNNTFEGAFDWSNVVNEARTVAVRLTGLYRDGETEIEDSENDRAFLAGSLTWAPTDDTSLTLLAHVQKDELTPINFYPIAGEDYDTAWGRLPEDYSLKQSDYNHFDTEQTSLGWELSHGFGDGFTFNQKFRFAAQSTDYGQLDYSYADQSGLHYYAFRNDEDARSIGFGNNLEWKTAHTLGENSFIAGADLQYNKYDVTQYLDYSLYDVSWSGPNLDFPVSDPTTSTSTRNTYLETGLYFQDHMKFDFGSTLTFGLRQSWFETEVENLRSNSKQDQFNSALTGMIGVTHQFENGLIPYASYTEGFIQNFGKTINGNPLDPSKSKQWEAGLRYEFPSGDLMVSAAAFDLRKTNVRDYDLNDPTFSSFTQAGEVRSRGIELEARGRITENLQGVLAYTYLDTEITKASDPAKIGNENAMAPPHQFAAWLDYDVSDLVEGLSVGAGVRFNSSAYSTQYNLRETPSYAIADASLRYEIDQFEVYLGVTNLFDEEYYGVCYDSYGCTDGERRRISLSVSTRF